MRHFGHGVGHLQYRTLTPQDLDSGFESGTMVNANTVLDNDTSRDIEVETELESDTDCDSASATASEDSSEASDDSSNDSDEYASF